LLNLIFVANCILQVLALKGSFTLKAEILANKIKFESMRGKSFVFKADVIGIVSSV